MPLHYQVHEKIPEEYESQEEMQKAEMKMIVKEHILCRQTAGIIDISHKGQIHVSGDEAMHFLESISVADLSSMDQGQCTKTLILNENGGIKDECIIAKETDTSFHLIVSASCKEKVLEYMKLHLSQPQYRQ